MKCLLQDLWKGEIQWDDPLPTHIEKEWKKWCEELPHLRNLKIPRLVYDSPLLEDDIELHSFCDASKKAYGAAIYLTTKSRNGISVKFVTSKSRVAPLNCVTLPRLELLGALVAAHLASKVNLKRSGLQYHWTDSKIIRFWIKADFLSRVLRADCLVSNSRWWTSAEFLSDSEFPKNFQQVVPELDYLTEHEKEVQERKKLLEADRSEETVLLNSDSSSILDELLELSNNYFKVEGILNSRQLTPLSSDADNFDVLTPGHFLIGRPITSIPELNLIDVNENRLSRWEKITKVVQRTWENWKSDYLNTLQARSKWITEKNDLMIGQMVLIKEDFLPISTWPLARILKVYHGSDRKARVVKVKIQPGKFKRAISKIAVLPIDTK
ncbi:integrase catalytic domain-containing protein [Trichonephila clavipes]|nr:integrase catalytic domain-containing protein [Trichonephila clavipes]